MLLPFLVAVMPFSVLSEKPRTTFGLLDVTFWSAFTPWISTFANAHSLTSIFQNKPAGVKEHLLLGKLGETTKSGVDMVLTLYGLVLNRNEGHTSAAQESSCRPPPFPAIGVTAARPSSVRQPVGKYIRIFHGREQTRWYLPRAGA